MTDQLLYGTAVVPAIVGLVQVAKDAGLSQRFAPLLAVILGVLAGAAQTVTSAPAGGPGVAGPAGILAGVITGIGLGLAAAGLYSGYKTVMPSTAPFTPMPGTRTDGRTDPTYTTAVPVKEVPHGPSGAVPAPPAPPPPAVVTQEPPAELQPRTTELRQQQG